MMKIRFKPTLLLITASLLITACGSGGGSTDNTNTNTGTGTGTGTAISSSISSSSMASSSMISSSEPANKSIKTGDLVAAEDFDFATQKNVRINVQSSDVNIQNTRYQLNFYTSFQMNNNVYLPHFKTQFASGVLLKGKFTQSIQLPTNTQTILAELWAYDGSAPIQALLSIEGNAANWEL